MRLCASRHASWFLASIAVSVVLTVSSASAQVTPDDAQHAEALKAEGRSLLLDRKHTAALEKFEAAQRLNPDDVTLLYNIGRALEFMGEYPRALDSLEQFAARAPAALRANVTGLDELIADVRARVGTLSVTCTPAAARALVFLDDRRIAEQCDGASIRVRTGKGVVRVEAEGYFAASVSVSIESTPVRLLVPLEPRATSGKVRITSSPPSARIFIGGDPIGDAPLETVLPAGEYQASASLLGYQDLETRFVVERGATSTLDLELRKNVPITSTWWFWTGIGVVVASAATVAIVVASTTEKDPTPGSIAPGIIQTKGFSF